MHHSGSGKQPLGFGDVRRRDGHVLDVPGAWWRLPLVPGSKLTVEHNLVQRAAVDRQLERLAHSLVLAKRILGAIAIGQIYGDAVVSEAGDGIDLEPRILACGIEI